MARKTSQWPRSVEAGQPETSWLNGNRVIPALGLLHIRAICNASGYYSIASERHATVCQQLFQRQLLGEGVIQAPGFQRQTIPSRHDLNIPMQYVIMLQRSITNVKSS